MRKNILFSLAGFVLGALILTFVLWKIAPSMMLLESESKYGFEETIQKYQEAVETNGWEKPLPFFRLGSRICPPLF